MYRILASTALVGLVPAAMVFADGHSSPDFPCLNPPSISSDFPGDTVLSDQPSFNCFAWQEFIAMNWPSAAGAGASDFGSPMDTSPVLFETYRNVHDFMNPEGSGPDASYLPTSAENPTLRALSRTGKLGNNFDPSADINEAAPGTAWLADKNNNLVWYEIFVNDVEYNYIAENEFFNSMAQYDAVSSGKKIDLPMGIVGGAPGAVELKAAWLAVPDPENTEKWSRYKLSEGVFCTDLGGSDQQCDTGMIALIGLHIIHKTTSQPSWTWATFEHVDNVPDAAAVANGADPDRDYLFYSANCTPRDVPAACQIGDAAPALTSCVPNTAPAYAIGPFKGKSVDPTSACQPYPIQVTREFPLPRTNENPIVQTNAAAHALIAAANPDSLYQNYQLINVLWSDSPVNENANFPNADDAVAAPPHAPLSKTAFRPVLTTFPVANPVLETYVQSTSCLECHSGASIAASPADANPVWASDYSFVFGMAGPGPAN